MREKKIVFRPGLYVYCEIIRGEFHRDGYRFVTVAMVEKGLETIINRELLKPNGIGEVGTDCTG